MYNYTTISCMEQLNLSFLDTITDSTPKKFKYTVGITKKSNSIWWVNNNSPDKNKLILEKLLQYPDTIPTQSNYKFFEYQLDTTAR